MKVIIKLCFQIKQEKGFVCKNVTVGKCYGLMGENNKKYKNEFYYFFKLIFPNLYLFKLPV